MTTRIDEDGRKLIWRNGRWELNETAEETMRRIDNLLKIYETDRAKEARWKRESNTFNESDAIAYRILEAQRIRNQDWHKNLCSRCDIPSYCVKHLRCQYG